MKFDAKRHNLHPVLTPTNDDYPEGSLTVTISDPLVINDRACLNIEFHLSEPAIAGIVKRGEASCKAMIYCRGTLFRSDLQAPEGTLTIQAEIPMDQLIGVVEVHPFIVSTKRIELAPETVHPEYKQQNASLLVEQRQPLAAANRHEFHVTAQEHKLEALFIFESDPENPLPTGQYDLKIEPNERQIAIVVNENEYQQLMTLRAEKTLALSSMYMSAMVQALSVLEYTEEEEDIDESPPNGWFQYLKSRKKPNVTPFRMAQEIFDQPFQKLIASIPNT